MRTTSLTLLALLVAVASSSAALAGGHADAVAAAARAQASADKFEGVVTKIEGDVGNMLVLNPDGSDAKIEVGARYAMGTTIETGEGETLILSLEGTQGGKEFKNAMMSIRPNTQMKLDTLAVQASNVVTRVQLKTGEVRIKVTDERQDFSTDMKVATPNATASVTGTDITQFGYNANKGTYVALAAGELQANRNNGTSSKVTGGTGLSGNSGNTLEEQLRNSTRLLAPLGMNVFEVQVGQLAGGTERFGSDNNNSATNPNANRGTVDSQLGGHGGGFGSGQPLPATPGRMK